MTPLHIAAQAVELVEAGYSQNKASQMVGLNRTTVREIIHGVNSWGEIAQTTRWQQIRQEQKKALESASRTLASKLLVHAEANYDKMSAYQAVGMYGILRQHERLDAGEPTQISANLDVHVLESGDKLAALLANALTAKSKSIDVSSNQTDK